MTSEGDRLSDHRYAKLHALHECDSARSRGFHRTSRALDRASPTGKAEQFPYDHDQRVDKGLEYLPGPTGGGEVDPHGN